MEILIVSWKLCTFFSPQINCWNTFRNVNKVPSNFFSEYNSQNQDDNKNKSQIYWKCWHIWHIYVYIWRENGNNMKIGHFIMHDNHWNNELQCWLFRSILDYLIHFKLFNQKWTRKHNTFIIYEHILGFVLISKQTAGLYSESEFRNWVKLVVLITAMCFDDGNIWMAILWSNEYWIPF